MKFYTIFFTCMLTIELMSQIDNTTIFSTNIPEINKNLNATPQMVQHLFIEYGTGCINSDPSISTTNLTQIPVRLVNISGSAWSETEMINAYNFARARLLNSKIYLNLKGVHNVNATSLQDIQIACNNDLNQISNSLYDLRTTFNDIPLFIIFTNQVFANTCAASDNPITGVACFPGTGGNVVLLSHSSINLPNVNREITLTHELGHAFGLFHTHEDSFGSDSCNNPSSCDNGDYIHDTPYDPYPDEPFYRTYDVAAPFCIADNPGVICLSMPTSLKQTVINNYMSYYGNCRSSFTPFQIKKMHDIATNGFMTDICEDLTGPSEVILRNGSMMQTCNFLINDQILGERFFDSDHTSNSQGKFTWEIVNINGTVVYSTLATDLNINANSLGLGIFTLRVYDLAAYNNNCKSCDYTLLFEVQSACNSTTETKTSIANGNWSNPNIWSPVGVPQCNDNVIVNNNVTLTGYAECKSMESQANFTIGNTGALSISGSTQSGIIINSGVFINNGYLKIENVINHGINLELGSFINNNIISTYDTGYSGIRNNDDFKNFGEININLPVENGIRNRTDFYNYGSIIINRGGGINFSGIFNTGYFENNTFFSISIKNLGWHGINNSEGASFNNLSGIIKIFDVGRDGIYNNADFMNSSEILITGMITRYGLQLYLDSEFNNAASGLILIEGSDIDDSRCYIDNTSNSGTNYSFTNSGILKIFNQESTDCLMDLLEGDFINGGAIIKN